MSWKELQAGYDAGVLIRVCASRVLGNYPPNYHPLALKCFIFNFASQVK